MRRDIIDHSADPAGVAVAPPQESPTMPQPKGCSAIAVLSLTTWGVYADDSGFRPADSVTVGTVTATSSTVDVPVYIRDVSGTPLGMDQAAGAKIQSFSIKVAWSPASAVSSVSFTRTGITSALSPTAESRPSTSVSRSLLDTFPESGGIVPFTSNAGAPGDLVAHLLVTLNGSAVPGSSISLALDPSVTLLANDQGTIKETRARGTLVLVDGAININIPVQGLAVPPAVSAFAERTASKQHAMNADASSAHNPLPDSQGPHSPIYLTDAGPAAASSLRRSPTAQSYLTTTNHDEALTYDAAGDVTVDDQGRLLTYDALNMTTGISLPLPNGATRNFLDIYTADDERIALVEKLASGETKTRWTLRGLDNRALRTWTDNTFNGTHAWGWSEDEIFAEPLLLAYVSSNGIRDYGVDHLGSTVVVTDPNGHLIGNINYDAFGAGGATGAGMLQYTGHERDAANAGAQTGSVRLPDYLHTRNYDPLRGRFLSADRHLGNLLRPQSWNRYTYVLNSPLNAVDPTGLDERNPGQQLLPGDSCNGTAVQGWCTGETITVEAEAPKIDLIAILEPVSNFSAAFGDTLTFGLTKKIRQAQGTDQVVNPCSGSYLGGQIAGTVWWTAAGGEIANAAFGVESAAAELGNITVKTSQYESTLAGLNEAQKLATLGGPLSAFGQAARNIVNPAMWGTYFETTMSTGPTLGGGIGALTGSVAAANAVHGTATNCF